MLMKLFGQEPVKATWLSKSFRQAITAQQLTALRDDLAAELGLLKAVEPGEGVWRMSFERGVLPVFLQLNSRGEINTLWFNPIEPPGPLDADQIRELMANFDGQVSVLVEREGETLLSQHADTPLAVGSAFKLTVLQALRAAIARGDISADEELVLRRAQKSLPSGQLQDKSDGSRWRIDDLARRMIAHSDNTATDMLIERVGRSAIEALAPRNTPFLKTAEVFRLKNPDNAVFLARWRDGERAAVLDELEQTQLPAVSLFAAGPVALDIEWFYSVRELCTTLKVIGFDPIVTVNTAQLDPSHWARVAYKGGSEPGVFNQSFLLEDHDGRHSCVVASWNNPEGMVTIPFLNLVSHLARFARTAG